MQPRNRLTFIIDLFRRDCWRKLVALFLALLLYLAIAPRTGEKKEKTFTNVPVYIEMPSHLALSSNEIRKVKITLTGNADVLNNIDPGDLAVRTEIDAEQVVLGELYQLRLRISDVKNLPYGVRVSSISPRELPLDIEQVSSKSVPVVAHYIYQEDFSSNYRITNKVISPPRVVITGPKRLVDMVQEVPTPPITLNDQVTKDFEFRGQLSMLPGIRSETTEATIRVYVAPITGTRKFENIPIKVKSPDGQHELRVDFPPDQTATVTLEGPLVQLKLLTGDAISASIDVTRDTPPGQQSLPITVSLDNNTIRNENIRIQSCYPQNVLANVINPQVKKDEQKPSGQAPERQ